ncbi:MAG: nuclear transport factor 2 family protein [Pseudolabrys sp.]
MDDAGSARAVLVEVQTAFRDGNYARMAELYDDDIDWLFHAPVSVFPETGHRRGKIAVFLAFEALNRLYRFDSYETEQVLAEGDRAAGIANVTLTQRSSGRVIQVRVAGFHRVRDGRIVEYRGFVDSFDAVEQALGRIVGVE